MVSATLSTALRKPAFLARLPLPKATLKFGVTLGAEQAAASAFSQFQARPGTVYGIQNYGTQAYLPVAERRPLSGPETAEVQRGLSRWWPELFSNYSTPMANLLASPAKSAIVSGIGGALAGGLLMLSALNPMLTLAGVAGGAVLGAVGGFANRKRENGNILDILQRMPPGATKRDLLSDPVYQRDLDRRTATSGSGFGDALTTALLVNSLGSCGGRSYYPGRLSGTRRF